MVTRVALYARLSLSKDESVSIARQLDSCRQEAAQRGWEVVLEAADDGVSASRTRPDQRAGWRTVSDRYADLDAVLYWKTDRLARRVIDFYNLAEETQRHGVALVSATEPQLDLSTAQGRAFAGMLAIFAEMEADAISARSRAARAYIISEGRAPGGSRPWPLAVADNEDGPGKVWRPVPGRAEMVREAAADIIAGSTSIKGVVARWNRAGVEAKHSGEWWASSVQLLLRNPALYGARVHHGELVRAADGTIRVDEDQAIMSRAEWTALQDALDARSRKRDSPETHPRALLFGVAECAGCGGKLITHRPKGRPHRYYCENRDCHARVSVTMPLLDDYVVSWYLGAWSWVPERVAVKEVQRGDADEVAEIQTALDDVQEALDATDNDEQAVKLVRRRRELREALQAAQDAADVVETRYAETGRTVADAWYTTEDHEERRRILAASIGAVVVDKGERGKHGLDPSRVTILGPGDV